MQCDSALRGSISIKQQPCMKDKQSRSCSPPLQWWAAWPSDRTGSPCARPAAKPPRKSWKRKQWKKKYKQMSSKKQRRQKTIREEWKQNCPRCFSLSSSDAIRIFLATAWNTNSTQTQWLCLVYLQLGKAEWQLMEWGSDLCEAWLHLRY